MGWTKFVAVGTRGEELTSSRVTEARGPGLSGGGRVSR